MKALVVYNYVNNMPYAQRGNTIVKKGSGKVVGHSANPKKYMRVLNAIEHGWKPNKKRYG